MSQDTIQIFVGCDPNDCDLEQMMVLDYSVRMHASLPVNIHWMRLSQDTTSFWYSDPARDAGWHTGRWATPFSGFRWAVPAYCGYQGRAIYMDTDMIVLTDIARLWQAPLDEGKVVMARSDTLPLRFCVSIWDCAKAQAQLPTLDQLRREPSAHARCLQHFRSHRALIQAIDPAFNCIDGEHQPIDRIAILHYSDMGTQFSHRLAFPRLAEEGKAHWFDGPVKPHPRQDLTELFERYYHEALASGRKLDDYRNVAPFGAVIKKTERHHAGNHVTRSRLAGLTRRLLGR